MSQTFRYWVDNSEVQCELPDAETEVVSGVQWGEPWALFTPAYWVSQLWMSGYERASNSPYKARGSLNEEIVFCMLGGYGITAELATAAFETCRDSHLISRLDASEEAWLKQLTKPLQVNGRQQHYRYPKQKARFLAAAMAYLHEHPVERYRGKELRDKLLNISGIGPKTAGWVTRNYCDSDEVAILDIHLVRAGLLCNLFSPSQRVERDYFEMESRFIRFCDALNARPALLDCLIWDQMRAYGVVALEALHNRFGDAEAARIVGQPKVQLQLPV